MPTYEFRCDDHGTFEVAAAMGRAGDGRECPTCGCRSVRVFSAPMLALADRRIVGAMDAADRSRDAPEVVTALPPRASAPAGRRVRAAPPNPALRRLPRP